MRASQWIDNDGIGSEIKWVLYHRALRFVNLEPLWSKKVGQVCNLSAGYVIKHPKPDHPLGCRQVTTHDFSTSRRRRRDASLHSASGRTQTYPTLALLARNKVYCKIGHQIKQSVISQKVMRGSIPGHSLSWYYLGTVLFSGYVLHEDA